MRKVADLAAMAIGLTALAHTPLAKGNLRNYVRRGEGCICRLRT